MTHFISLTPVRLSALFGAVALLLPSLGVASECKGKTQDACAATAACIWVEGYTRKDGREVSSYCRVASARKSIDEKNAEKLQTSAVR